MNALLMTLNRFAHFSLDYYEVTPSGDIYLVFRPPLDVTDARRVMRIAGEVGAVRVTEVPYDVWKSEPRKVWNHTLDKWDEFGTSQARGTE